MVEYHGTSKDLHEVNKTNMAMLIRLSRLQLVSIRSVLNSSSPRQRAPVVNSVRTVVYSESGAVMEKPQRVPLGLLKVLVVVGLSVFVGGSISKRGAEFLEEHDLFVPDEDDD